MWDDTHWVGLQTDSYRLLPQTQPWGQRRLPLHSSKNGNVLQGEVLLFRNKVEQSYFLSITFKCNAIQFHIFFHLLITCFSFIILYSGWCQQWPSVVRRAAVGSWFWAGRSDYWSLWGGHHEQKHGGHFWSPGEGLGHTGLHAGGYESKKPGIRKSTLQL